MKVVILCGGLGTRLREETEFRPKPLVEIGQRPILWHIMKLYAHHGLRDFVLCLGYRGQMIKEFEDTAFSLQLNQISKPFTTTYGAHIIQLLERDAMRPLEGTALQQQQQSAFTNWLDQQRLTAQVERFYKDEYVPTEVKKAVAQIQALTQQ